jgi:hypothetical protein
MHEWYGSRASAPREPSRHGTDAQPTSGLHLAFQAADAAAVARFHAAGIAAGGRDDGPPGERAYHPGFYAAYLLDPDGNDIEAVWHERTQPLGSERGRDASLSGGNDRAETGPGELPGAAGQAL